MTHLPGRVAGVVLMGIAVMWFDPLSTSALHRLLVPLLMAAAAWLMVQNAAAVLLGVTLLTTIHTDLQSNNLISSRAYPALAILAAGALGYILWLRFRSRIEATREERWRSRTDRSSNKSSHQDEP
ncbi:MAG: hypothetical protein OES38_02140 [Gammaproteobacteria bacterium]|nr:hypothetical protein [Gammaproteobacteria bacterium]